MIAFHALTGSDSTSYLAGHSKKSCWNVFKENHDLLQGLGDCTGLNEQMIANAVAFVCKLYDSQSVTTSVNQLRSNMFIKGLSIEKLPPTQDALSHHIMRSHYQASVWQQTCLQRPHLPPPETMGWALEEGALVPLLTSLPPVPKACEELISCGFFTQCRSQRCSCKRDGMPCMAWCKCHGNCLNTN